MESSNTQIFYWASFVLLTVFLMSNAAAEETIIQQEKISFEKCLQVITTSQDKLFVAPEIKDISDQSTSSPLSMGSYDHLTDKGQCYGLNQQKLVYL